MTSSTKLKVHNVSYGSQRRSCGHRQHVQKIAWNLVVWLLTYASRPDRQTNRQTDRQSCSGKVITRQKQTQRYVINNNTLMKPTMGAATTEHGVPVLERWLPLVWCRCGKCFCQQWHKHCTEKYNSV